MDRPISMPSFSRQRRLQSRQKWLLIKKASLFVSRSWLGSGRSTLLLWESSEAHFPGSPDHSPEGPIETCPVRHAVPVLRRYYVLRREMRSRIASGSISVDLAYRV